MPKILINEKDSTSPGTPGNYANFSVLVTGFAKNTFTDEEKNEVEAKRAKAADANGVYEFSNADDFKNIIGLVAPVIDTDEDGNKRKLPVRHYGNQMAYELLKMGYSIIYKPIETVSELCEASTWEIFKDKASYDFRFITHGLLESASATDSSEYAQLLTRCQDVEDAYEKLNAIKKEAEEQYPDSTEKPDQSAERANYMEDTYSGLKKEDFPGLMLPQSQGKRANTYYSTFGAAMAGTAIELYGEGGTEAEPKLDSLKAKLKDFTKDSVTATTINDANNCIANLAKYAADANGEPTPAGEIPGRGDCIALIELDESAYLDTNAGVKAETLIIDAINKMSIDKGNGKYCAMTVPSVHYNMVIDKEKPNEFNNNTKFPGAFHYLACFINSLKQGFAEWYAAAGYTRGVANYTVDHTSVKLGEIAINALEPRNYDDPQENYPKFACNVIANFRGSYYLWGNRTAHPLGKKGSLTDGDLVASSFLNIRQLCTTIKKQLYVACRTFTFDPNSDTLWVNFTNAIRPTLEAMKADQGIRDYKIVKEYTDKKATLKAKIRIIPIEAVEDFNLEVSLEDSFGETTAVVNE